MSRSPKLVSPTPKTNDQLPAKKPELSDIVEDSEYVAYFMGQQHTAEKKVLLGSSDVEGPSWDWRALWEKRKPSFDSIKEKLNYYYMNPGAPWGFVIYRTVYGKESEHSWGRMLEEIRDAVAETLSQENSKEPEKLLPYFVLTVMEDESRFAGADSHTIRQAFRNWVAEDLPPRLRDPDRYGGIDNLRAMIRNHGIRNKEHNHPWYHAPPRWNFCLLVDDICLRSLDHPLSNSTVIKIVHTDFDDGRCKDIAEGWEDGETDEPEEDVGWMHIYASEYVEWYERLQAPQDWIDMYQRPKKTENLCGSRK
jgi:hypothetical protein